jgi:antitoxin CcdA
MGKGELNIDPELVARAEAIGVAAKRVAEEAIHHAIRAKSSEADDRARARQWAVENAEAIKAHREQIEKYGVFGDDLRTW